LSKELSAAGSLKFKPCFVRISVLNQVDGTTSGHAPRPVFKTWLVCSATESV